MTVTTALKPRPAGSIERNAAIRARLLRWYRRHARALPWRATRDPYAIWVSEIMLQQTQVATVIPYYRCFIRAFPDCHRLAEARFSRVAELWSGLGYYRRARSLHQGAQKIVKEFGGHFPRDYDQARQIPGVGHYTACAILSIAYNERLPVLDGNAARVVARVEALAGNMSQPGFRRAAELRLGQLISPSQPGNFNQALMELGQTVCLAHAPRCTACPLCGWCQASKLGIPEIFPSRRPRRPTESLHLAVAVIRKGDQAAFVRGLDGKLVQDLWNFPSAFGKNREEARAKLKAKLSEVMAPRVSLGPEIGTVRHSITYRSIQASIYAVEPSRIKDGGAFLWIPLARTRYAAVSQLTKKIVNTISVT